MSPDEYLLLLPYGETDAALATIAEALKGQHHLAVTLSDARAVFRVEGAKADQVLAKLSPVDFATLGAERTAPHPRRTGGGGVLARRRRLYAGLLPLGRGLCDGIAQPFGNQRQRNFCKARQAFGGLTAGPLASADDVSGFVLGRVDDA